MKSSRRMKRRLIVVLFSYAILLYSAVSYYDTFHTSLYLITIHSKKLQLSFAVLFYAEKEPQIPLFGSGVTSHRMSGDNDQ